MKMNKISSLPLFMIVLFMLLLLSPTANAIRRGRQWPRIPRASRIALPPGYVYPSLPPRPSRLPRPSCLPRPSYLPRPSRSPMSSGRASRGRRSGRRSGRRIGQRRRFPRFIPKMSVAPLVSMTPPMTVAPVLNDEVVPSIVTPKGRRRHRGRGRRGSRHRHGQIP